ncbi:uncharacterized protein L201_006102 [Kwoniella dendrophila CBS 6074]|uniref:Uncharacterized protein n=1 Tax=Kwoniella dendrophila CBS 6074 TaxID=1295534 RepID=A0AAX4K0S2_9TREE
MDSTHSPISSPCPKALPINAATQVFQNTFLRPLIFNQLDRQSLINYKTLIKRCCSAERLQLYLGAVHTVDLSHLTRTIQITYWGELLDPFPNAKVIRRYNEFVSREYHPCDSSSEAKFTYTYSYPHAERLFLSPSEQKHPLSPAGIPCDWKQFRRVTLNAYHSDFEKQGEENPGERWNSAIINRMQYPDGEELEGISADFPIPNRIVLDTLRKLDQKGLCKVKQLHLNSSDQDLFELLSFLSSTLTTLDTHDLDQNSCNIDLQDLFIKIP